MEKIKVFLSDPQVLFREGIHFILSGEEDFEVTGETTGNEEAFSLIESNSPNIAILSMNDPKAAGPDITRRVRRNLPSVFVILTMDKKEPEQIFAAIKSGASACITKDTDPEELLDIIRVVSQGSLPLLEDLMTPALASLVINEFKDLAALNEQFDNLMSNLTTKEQQILAAIATGNTVEQIAAKLETDGDTTRRNIRLILNKMVVNDQARAVIEAAQRSLPSIIRSVNKGTYLSEYVTRSEFNEFKEQLMKRFKSFIGDVA